MTSQDFFHRLSAQYAMRLPFVAYRKPKSAKIQVIFQNDSQLHEARDLSETGFVFAPFQKNEKTIFIPGTAKSAAITKNEDEENASVKPAKNDQNLSKARENHLNLVKTALKTIKSTNIEKVVLSRKQLVNNDKAPVTLFKQLVAQYEDAFTYLWFHPKVGLWLGATPEGLLQISGLSFKTMALAGTQVYEEGKEPVWGAKEQEEQQLVVNSIKRKLEGFDIKKFKIAERKTIRAGNLLHLQTPVSGILKREDQFTALVKTLHPTPAVSGFPEDLATDFILKNENYNRHFYTGYLGEINQKQEQSRSRNRRNTENLAYKSIKNTSSLYVNLRCMQYNEQEVALYIGGGITADSQPEKEWLETVAKAQTMMQILHKN